MFSLSKYMFYRKIYILYMSFELFSINYIFYGYADAVQNHCNHWRIINYFQIEPFRLSDSRLLYFSYHNIHHRKTEYCNIIFSTIMQASCIQLNLKMSKNSVLKALTLINDVTSASLLHWGRSRLYNIPKHIALWDTVSRAAVFTQYTRSKPSMSTTAFTEQVCDGAPVWARLPLLSRCCSTLHTPVRTGREADRTPAGTLDHCSERPDGKWSSRWNTRALHTAHWKLLMKNRMRNSLHK